MKIKIVIYQKKSSTSKIKPMAVLLKTQDERARKVVYRVLASGTSLKVKEHNYKVSSKKIIILIL